MPFRKSFIFFLTAFLTMGCVGSIALLDEVVKFDEPHRVIEHSFDQKYGLIFDQVQSPIVEKNRLKLKRLEKEVLLENDSEYKSPELPMEDQPLAYVEVEFYSESSVAKQTKKAVQEILALKADQYLIVGHSHGNSQIGVAKLAAERARYISIMLHLAGVSQKKLHVVSSFSDSGEGYSIAKGVRVFGLPEKLTLNQSLITGINRG